MAEINVRSEQFEEGGEIPSSAAHEMVGGDNKSPSLTWSGVPAGTKSIAVTCWDPDAPTTVGFSHWIRVGIAPDTDSLPEGSGTESGAWQDGISDWGQTGYGGMAPPPGDPPHHYQFTVYALDSKAEELGLDDHATYAKLRFLVRGHTLGSGTLVGTFAVEG